MTAILVKTAEGRTVIIETGDDPKIITAAGGGGTTANAAEKVLDRLKDVGDTIADVCKSVQIQVMETLKATRPTELTLEFGVKLAGEAGVPLVTKGSVEGTFQVTATWKFEAASGGRHNV